MESKKNLIRGDTIKEESDSQAETDKSEQLNVKAPVKLENLANNAKKKTQSLTIESKSDSITVSSV